MGDNIPPDVTPPTVTQTWDGNGPPMDGTVRGGPTWHFGKGVPQKPGADGPPIVPPYVVAPGSIEDATAQMLTRTRTLVDSYTSLKDYINDTKSWIFDAPNDNTIGQPYYHGTQKSVYPDEHPDWTKEMTAVSDNLLLQVADALELCGQYIDALNNAGQFYTRADKSSVMPTLPVQREQGGARSQGPTGIGPGSST